MRTMFFSFSKQNFLSEVASPFSLPDHSPSFKEYTGSKNNRFLSPAQASKNRIQPPSKVYTHSHSTLFSVSFVRWNFSKEKKLKIFSRFCDRFYTFSIRRQVYRKISWWIFSMQEMHHRPPYACSHWKRNARRPVSLNSRVLPKR